jgi:hypothetical protein
MNNKGYLGEALIWFAGALFTFIWAIMHYYVYFK